MRISEQAINNVIILKQALACVGPEVEALAGVRGDLLSAIKKVCGKVRSLCWVKADG